MASKGQVGMHIAQTVHSSVLTCAFPPFMLNAPSGQVITQFPQPLQIRSSIMISDMFVSSKLIKEIVWLEITPIHKKYAIKSTNQELQTIYSIFFSN